jgi:hypothetical protein
MIAFLFAIMLIEEKTEAFDTLTPMEIEQIEELPAVDRRYTLALVKNVTLPTRRDWFNVTKGELFLAPDVIEIDQVVDESNFIGGDREVWVEGVNTSNLSDDALLRTKGAIFLCDGNKQYKTVLGSSKTVMNVVRVRPENSLDVLKAIAEPRGYHVWGEGSQHLVIAKYLSSSSRSVTIQPLSGKRTTIKREVLTPVDEEWVSAQELEKKQKKDAAK